MKLKTEWGVLLHIYVNGWVFLIDRYLVVGLHIFRGAPVDDAPYVGLVDAHPEGDRGHHHLHLVVHERSVGLLCKLKKLNHNQTKEKKR